MNKPIAEFQHPKMLLDPYAIWAAKEGVPIHEDFGVDLLRGRTAPWPRFGVDGAIVHVKGRGDFMTVFAARPPARRQDRAAEAHVRGGWCTCSPATAAPSSSATRASAISSNGDRRACSRCRSTPATSSSTPPAASAPASPRPYNLGRAQSVPQRAIRLRQPVAFPEREGRRRISRRGRFHPGQARQAHVGDELPCPTRAASSCTSGAHAAPAPPTSSSSSPTACCTPTSRKCRSAPTRRRTATAPDVHVYIISGEGYSLLWYEGDKDFVRASTGGPAGCSRRPTCMFHQHFNTAPSRCAIIAFTHGSVRYPMTAHMRRVYAQVDVRREEGRQPDRIRGPGPAHPSNLSVGARQARREVRHGQVRQRGGVSSAR